MPMRTFLRQHLIHAPLLIGAVLAMTAGLTLGSYLKAGGGISAAGLAVWATDD